MPDTDHEYEYVGTRDLVWAAVLLALAEHQGRIRQSDVREHLEVQLPTRTINRIMSAMTELGWLEHEPQNPYYYPGPQARAHLVALNEW